MYIGDELNHRVRKVTVSTGIITTIAGTGTSGYSGDGGTATSATLNGPGGLALDSTGTLQLLFIVFCLDSLNSLGNVYIADIDNFCIRKVTVSTGIITSIAGTGAGGYFGDNGQATSALLIKPNAVTLDEQGDVFSNFFQFFSYLVELF